MSKESSFMAAGTIPTKLLHNQIIDGKRIIPVHLQLIPTNDCNLHCDFCSCSDADRTKQLTLDQMMQVIDVSSERGTKAITITGGGEPLMHPGLNEVIWYANKRGIQVGLTTNGVLLNRLKKHENLTWCRISSSDDRTPNYQAIRKAISVNPETDWAFAHVVTKEPDYQMIREIVDFTNENQLSHVKLHPDLFNLPQIPMDMVRAYLEDKDTSRVIWQDRDNITRGTKNCYISLLKPMVAPEGIFGCCGAQYAIKGQERVMTDRMKMGDVEDLAKILDAQVPFNGAICDVCYYTRYNDALSKLKDKPRHKEFL